ncbi:MAG TPA: DUF1801 domain-containing protein [Thermoanaerobaculia bacterium]|nr:DUF1801 domain-containing protein [Thermoanaerobaculia bacterium]
MASTSTRTSTDVAKFLDELPSSRRDDVIRVRDVIRKNLPKGYEEAVVKKMLVYQVPLSRYPDTYNGHALWYLALALQKAYLSLHLMPIYFDPAQAAKLKRAGKKLDIGKGCVRFKRADDLPFDTVGEIIAATPVDRWIAIAEASRRR